MPNPYDELYTGAAPDVAEKVGGGLLGGAGAFLSSTGGGAIAVGLMQLAGGILTSMFAEEPPRQLTPQEIAFKRMTKFYGRMGERQDAMRSIVAGYRGVTPDKVTDVGFANTRDMIQKVPFTERGTE